MSTQSKIKPLDIVRLKNRTDRYRVYLYYGRFIFVGLNTDIVTDEIRDTVIKILERKP